MDRDRDASLHLWIVLNRAQHAIGEHIRRDMEARGLGLTEFAVLEALYHKGSLALGEIGDRILLTSGTMTYVINKLEEQGLLRRRPCEEDRRRTFAELTEEGRARIATLFPEHAAVLRDLMGGLSTEEKETAAALMKRLGRFAEKAAAEKACE